MAITLHGDKIYGKIDFTGIASDPKPTDNVKTEAKYYELDTGKYWIYNSKNINPDTGNGWWVYKGLGGGLSEDDVIDGGTY